MKGMLMIVKSIFLSWNPVIFSINDLNIQQNVSDSLSGTTPCPTPVSPVQ